MTPFSPKPGSSVLNFDRAVRPKGQAAVREGFRRELQPVRGVVEALNEIDLNPWYPPNAPDENRTRDLRLERTVVVRMGGGIAAVM